MSDFVQGGLDYRIEVGGNWQPTLDQFEKRIKDLGKGTTVQTPSTAVNKAVTQETQKQAKYQREIANSTREQIAIDKKIAQLEAQIVTLQSEQVRVLQRETDQLKRLDSLDKQRTLNQDKNIQATQRVARIQNDMAVKEASYNQLIATGNVSRKEAAKLVGVTASQAKQLGLRLWDAQTVAEEFLFTFRRLVGILAIFTLARKISGWIAEANREAVRFNEELELTEKGIAGIIASLSQVVDAQGNLVDGQEKYQLSLLKSREIIQLLRQDAIGSVATFEALTKAFQVAVGPGLAAGLDLEQVRELTKLLVEGATSLGVPLNQLSEEIRSLLQGTATAKNTRIAVLFGGAAEANKLVREAKQQGKFYEVLTGRLQGVRAAAKDAENTLAVLRSNLKDSFLLLTSQGAVDQTNELKNIFIAIKDTITQIDKNGNIGVTPEALATAREASNIVTTILESFRTTIDPDAILGGFTTLLASISASLAVLVPLVVDAINGIADGVRAALSPIIVIVKLIRKIPDELNPTLKILGFIVRYVIAFRIASWSVTKAWAVIQLLMGAKGALKSLSNLISGVFNFLSGLKASNRQLAASTVYMGTMSVQATAISAKMALATAGISVILGLLALAVTKLGIFDKLMGKIDGTIKDTDKEAKDLEATFAGIGQELEDLDKAFSDLPQQLRDLDESIAIEKAVAGLKGYLKEVEQIAQERAMKLEATVGELKTQLNINRQAEYELSLGRQTLKILSQRKQLKGTIIAQETELGGKVSQINELYARRLELKRMQSRTPEQEFEESVELERLIRARATAERSSVELRQQGFLQAQDELAILKMQTDELDTQTRKLEEKLEKERKGFVAPDISSLEASLKRAETELGAFSVNIDISSEAEEKLKKRVQELKKEIEDSKVQAGQIAFASDGGVAFNQALKESVKDASKLQEELLIVEARLKKLDVNRATSKILENRKATAQAELETAQTIIELHKEQIRADEIALQDALRLRRKQELEAYELQRKSNKEFIEANGSLLQNTKLALYEWERRLPSAAKAFADIAVSAIDGLANTVSQLFMDAVDPRKNVDIRTAFGEFFLGLAGDFVKELVRQLIARNIAGLLSDPLSGAVGGAASAVGGAASAVGGAASTAGGAASTAGGAAVSAGATGATAAGGAAASTAASEATIASGTAIGMGSVMSALLLPLMGGVLGAVLPMKITIGLLLGVTGAILFSLLTHLPIIEGLLNLIAFTNTVPFAKGGMVKGYTSGGRIPRPSYIPASDTVPAWLTPGEFVLTRGMVKQIGAGTLESWRQSMTPPSFAAAGGFVGRNSVMSFAGGGSVPNRNSVSGGSNNIKTVVLPVMPATNENMQKIMRGGDRAFSAGVNGVTMVGGKGNPNKSSMW